MQNLKIPALLLNLFLSNYIYTADRNDQLDCHEKANKAQTLVQFKNVSNVNFDGASYCALTYNSTKSACLRTCCYSEHKDSNEIILHKHHIAEACACTACLGALTVTISNNYISPGECCFLSSYSCVMLSCALCFAPTKKDWQQIKQK